MRTKLGDTLDAAKALQAHIRALDGTSRVLLADSMRLFAYTEPSTHDLTVHADRIVNTLSRALEMANQYPQKGRTKDLPRFQLAVDVADIFATCLDQQPTAYECGPYETLLATILYEATGHKPVDVHNLARKANKHRKER